MGRGVLSESRTLRVGGSRVDREVQSESRARPSGRLLSGPLLQPDSVGASAQGLRRRRLEGGLEAIVAIAMGLGSLPRRSREATKAGN